MTQRLGKGHIPLVPAARSASWLPAVLLLLAACAAPSINGRDWKPVEKVLHDNPNAPAVASSLEPGEYVTEKGWGRLKLIRQGENLLFSLNSVTGEAGCTLSGHVSDGSGIAKQDSIPLVCVVSFSRRSQGVEISAKTSAECSHFCGYNGGFEGIYFRTTSGCSQTGIEQTRKTFKQLYSSKDYKSALAKLAPILTNCLTTLEWEEEGGIRNDIAMAQYKNGLYHECLQTLGQYAEDAARDDDSIVDDWTPALAERYLSIVKTARTNIALCTDNEEK